MRVKHYLPLVNFVKIHAKSKVTRFDTPGHKAGHGLPAATKQLLAMGGAADMTLPDEARQWAGGCVCEAERLAAKLWGAKRSFFCYNGTTAAIQALLLGTLRPDDKVLVVDNCHRSVITGLILCGAMPIFVKTNYNIELQLDLNVTVNDIGLALQEHPNCRAVLITNPTYYGIGCDLRSIVKVVHSYGLPLLVDEAHGAHWRFSAELPEDALACGADVVAQSTHKMLNSLSQTSMLHVNSTIVDSEKIGQALKMLQSSSPNYLLVASLDAARADMAQNGCLLMERTLVLAAYIRCNIAALPLMCYNNDLIREIGGWVLDESKLVVDFAASGHSGAVIYEQLVAQNIMPEMCDLRNALFHITIGDDQRSADVLIEGLRNICAQPGTRSVTKTCCVPPRLTAAVTPHRAFFTDSERITVGDANGRISARTECFYPPGIPFLVPGAVIGAETLKYVAAMELAGYFAEGYQDKIKFLEVLAI